MTRKVKNPGRGYSGHEKIKLYVYDSKGKFLKEFESCTELRKEYYPHDTNTKRPLFSSKKWNLYKYETLPNGDFYSDYRIGRERILKFERIVNSPFCYNNATDKIPVKIYNLLGEEIGFFKNMHIASLVSKISKATIYHSCNEGKSTPKNELQFKYAN